MLVAAAAEELSYLRHRLRRQTQAWWDEAEHRDHYGVERSMLDLLLPRILVRRLRA